MRGSKAVLVAEEQGCCPTSCRRDGGEREGYWFDHGNKTSASEWHRGQNSFLVEVTGRCATKVNKGCTSTCKYHLCLWWKPNQNLVLWNSACSLQLWKLQKSTAKVNCLWNQIPNPPESAGFFPHWNSYFINRIKIDKCWFWRLECLVKPNGLQWQGQQGEGLAAPYGSPALGGICPSGILVLLKSRAKLQYVSKGHFLPHIHR